MKRPLLALFLGVAIVSVPSLLASLPAQLGWINAIQQKANYLLTPGALVGVVIAEGRIHDIGFPFLFVVNVLFNWFAAYLVLTVRLRRTQTEKTGSD